MRTLDELVERAEPGIDLVRRWIEESAADCLLLPPSTKRDQVLLQTQVTTRSPMGAIAYETGGILIDHGWLRFLGSGHPRLTRTLPEWNAGRSNGFYLVADDAIGGFFALNGGAFGEGPYHIFYWSPDSLEWQPLEVGFTDFFVWALSGRLAEFYSNLRWDTWQHEGAKLSGDQCFSFYPFLWAKEGSVATSMRREIPVQEAFDLKTEILRKFA